MTPEKNEMYDVNWFGDMRTAFEQGKTANSIFENPYWEDYPNASTDKDESMARHRVDGFVEGKT